MNATVGVSAWADEDEHMWEGERESEGERGSVIDMTIGWRLISSAKLYCCYSSSSSDALVSTCVFRRPANWNFRYSGIDR